MKGIDYKTGSGIWTNFREFSEVWNTGFTFVGLRSTFLSIGIPAALSLSVLCMAPAAQCPAAPQQLTPGMGRDDGGASAGMQGEMDRTFGGTM